VLIELRELGVLEVLRELALRQLDLAPRLGDDRQVGEARQLGAEPLVDPDLARRVRQVLLGPDHVADPHLDVVDDAGEVVKAAPVGALDHVVGLAGDREDGLMAALLALVAFTVYLATSLALPRPERNTPRS